MSGPNYIKFPGIQSQSQRKIVAYENAALGSQSIVNTYPFDPRSLRNLRLWFDAADTSTITASSNKVSQWNDKSSFATNVTQSTGSNQPSSGLVTRNGLNVISGFVGNATPINLAASSQSFTTNGEFTLMVVCNWTNPGTASGSSFYAEPIAIGQSGLTAQIVQLRASNSGMDFLCFNTSSTAYNSLGTVPPANTWVVVGGRFSSGQAQCIQSGGTLGPATTVTGTLQTVSAPLMIGSMTNFTTTQNFQGSIAEIVYYTRALNTNEYLALGEYLRHKWAAV
jgi:Concanavalin A-like lectin/glucanases superfamily